LYSSVASKSYFDIKRLPTYHLAMARKATTFRLDPTVQAGLALLSEELGRPQNQLVNEAVRELVQERVQNRIVDLSATLDRLKAYQAADPAGEKSMEKAMRAEAAIEHDPTRATRVQQKLAVGPMSARMLESLSD
jgi:predicted transcriptional regulator